MAPLIVLLLSFILLYLLGLLLDLPSSDWQVALQWALALMFLLTASAHWGKRRADLVRMVPSVLLYPGLIVTVTGILEILGAIALLLPISTIYIAPSLMLLLILMFPANIKATRDQLTIGGRAVPSLLSRILIQLIFIVSLYLTM
ncbi:DoxX family protein [Mechercharimyces sp. CAU 1602]|uniref:DoxX family protein n=1 Tax=Mechercharimyces sp. CAU 1602 TaxID=2973933 RepID=UPI0021635775|nr:DoxX family protein [Mechercharimyces sp. CAU 1602]MCS1352589.1 DoxX family protein [Mechercharimyces sp. CAU 1602]